MLKNYFIIAVRNLLQNKLFSFINIGGLSIGFAACILIFLFVQNELSYDNWIPENESIYRLEASYAGDQGMQDNPMAISPGALGIPLQKQFPNEIESLARVAWAQYLVKIGNKRFLESPQLIDSTFFDVLDLPMVSGDREQLFEDYNSIIISEDMAEKYFGNEPAIGQILNLDNGERLVKVVAVMKNIPENSHFEADFFLHLNEADYVDQPWMFTWWNSSNVYTYVKLAAPESPSKLLADIPSFINDNAIRHPSADTSQPLSNLLTFNLMPVRDIHLHSRGRFQMKATGDILIVYSFSAIALLILAIAVINFTNLSTARASMRSREIAVRKVVGATRKHIITQFLGEALITTCIALLVAFVLVEICLPWFMDFVGKLLHLAVFSDPVLQVGLIAVIAVVTLGAGAHPAFTMSKFAPAHVLHSNSSGSQGAGRFRFLLTTIQFTISIGLMITTAVIYSQVKHAQSMDTGINKSNKLALANMNYGPVNAVAHTLETEIKKLPGVLNTSFSDRTLPLQGYWDWPVTTGLGPNHEVLDLETIPADFGFLEMYGADLIAGRLFSEDRRADLYKEPAIEGTYGTQSAILNEKAVGYLGYKSPQDALGKTIYIDATGGNVRASTIVGVIKDMQLRSARDDIDPSVFLVDEGADFILNIDLAPNEIPTTVADIEAIWNRLIPDFPLSQFFVEERFNQFYQADQKRAEMFAYFSLFAILVSCLGLYGLAAFTTERRTKEIGIRKVMGAKVGEIVSLLTIQFSKPVLYANLIAWPCAWYFMHSWLQGFTARIDLSILYFISAGLVALTIACLTVAGHALKVAKANPINALRSN
ncbi:MAG: ABC transporter permease [Kordiimonas sp.]